MADKLTPQQAQAVHNRGGKLLVSAAAGSGKTKVLVDRLMTYLTDAYDPANLDDFLIITYTKAAAAELRGKIAAKLSERIAAEPENKHLQKQMQRLFLAKISTVHGFCGDLLREYAYRLDIAADFRVADENECRELRQTVLKDLLDRAYASNPMDRDYLAFVDSQGLGRDDRLIPDIVEKVYDSARCHLDPDSWLDTSISAAEVSFADDAVDTVWGKYLMEDLQEYLDSHIQILEQCAQGLEQSEGMEKPAENIRSTLIQLKKLQDAKKWDEIAYHRTIDYGRLSFPRKNVDQDLVDRVKAARNACKKGLDKKLQYFSERSHQTILDLKLSADAIRGLIATVKQFDKAYSAAKRSRRCLDFSDLEQKTLDLLLGKTRSTPTALAAEVGRRYREILVDEYQDSNGVQDAIFSALTKQRQNCFLVGDVKQSIYQFRLADPGIFLEKYQDYELAEEASEGQGRKVLLSHNFRSGPEVIEGVNAVFKECMTPKVGGLYYTEAEALREGIPHEILPDPAVSLYAIEVKEDTYGEEAAFVAREIRSMLTNGTLVRCDAGLRPVRAEDIVILLRSPGSAGGYFQKALEAQGIRCTSGGGRDLLKTQEIGTLRSFLRIIVNPRQDIPLISTLASPIFGVTAEELAQIRGEQKKGSVYDALLNSDNPRVLGFLTVLKTLRQEARMSTLSALLERCFALTHLDSVYASMPDGDAKQENLRMFFQLASDFEKGNLCSLSRFLEHLDAMEERGLNVVGSSVSGCVNIMSIHKSKGLEFPVVFLCNLSRKFNQESLRSQILCDRELGLGLSVADHANRIRYPSVAKRAIAAKMAAESVSEEMRVLYVAMTRARDRLIMTYASQKLEGDLREIALRQSYGGGELLSRDAICMGDWVLQAAVKRREAGALHVHGDRPEHTNVSKHPWNIAVVKAPESGGTVVRSGKETTGLPEDAQRILKETLSFQYPHLQATLAPSKQTATARKGRTKDEEAAQDTQEPKKTVRKWRSPSFREDQREGKTYGNAIHAAMQYIRYENCGSTASVEREIARLVEARFLTGEQGSMVNCESIARFFQTQIGQKLRSGVPCLREFKFSILDDGSQYGEGLEEERILLQGVVDCALLEEDGITVIDFKTDYVTETSVAAAAEEYRMQIHTYGEALSRIYEMPIKGRYIYFFRLNRFVQM